MKVGQQLQPILVIACLQVAVGGLLFLGHINTAQALRSPAAAYCHALGYDYMRMKTPRGDKGLCVLPGGIPVDAWKFLQGGTSTEHGYCAGQGYESSTIEDDQICGNIYSDTCQVCILPDGSEQEVTALMNLSFLESTCGDGSCGLSENYALCPEDCPSGGSDTLCDEIQDGRCDSDCVEYGGYDPDCPEFFVDVKPGSCPNPLNVKGRGVLAVAILGTAQFDVGDVDPRSIYLRRAGARKKVRPIRWRQENVSGPFIGEACGCRDAAPDAYMDLKLKFRSKDVVRVLKLHGREDNPVTLRVTARLRDGTPISGEDCVELVKKKNKWKWDKRIKN